MKRVDFISPAARLEDALKQLQMAWMATREHWNDPISQKVEDEYLVPLQGQIRSMLDAVGKMCTRDAKGPTGMSASARTTCFSVIQFRGEARLRLRISEVSRHSATGRFSSSRCLDPNGPSPESHSHPTIELATVHKTGASPIGGRGKCPPS